MEGSKNNRLMNLVCLSHKPLPSAGFQPGTEAPSSPAL